MSSTVIGQLTRVPYACLLLSGFAQIMLNFEKKKYIFSNNMLVEWCWWMEYWFGWFIILKNGWWNVIFSIRKESWTVDHFLSRPLHTHHRLHIIQATCKDLVFDQKINIQKHACKKKMVLLKLHKIQAKGKNGIFWVICFSNTCYLKHTKHFLWAICSSFLKIPPYTRVL